MPIDSESAEPKETKLSAEYVDIECQTTWQGKTGGYLRSESVILKIVDDKGHEVTAIWDTEWTEIAPGIEMRKGDDGTVRHLTGPTKYETRVDHRVRIHRRACPVLIQFADTNEYVDYSDSQYSSRDRWEHWVRYVA